MQLNCMFVPMVFFKVKNSYNKFITGMGFYFCLGFRRHFFRHTKSCDQRVFEKKIFFLNFSLKGVIEKCVSSFLVYLF